MKLLFTILAGSLFFGSLVQAQNKYIPPDPYSIQSGKQHFTKYMIVSPGKFGPNALPVPRISSGVVTEEIWAGLEYEQYKSNGELTRDVYADLRFPIAQGKASFIFYYVPYEFFRVDSLVSRERRSLTGKALEGSAHGDVYFGARVQLLKDKTVLPDLVFGMYCRTASGTNVEDARFTNTPGYYLDLTIGKSHALFNDSENFVRWYTMVGFYVWQTYLDEYAQNDALSFGGGIELQYGRIGFVNTIRGYSGYMHNGDHPLVYRSELQFHEGMASLIVGYERGIRDYPFSCFRAGIRVVGFSEK